MPSPMQTSHPVSTHPIVPVMFLIAILYTVMLGLIINHGLMTTQLLQMKATIRRTTMMNKGDKLTNPWHCHPHQLTPPAITRSPHAPAAFNLNSCIPPAHFYSKVPKLICRGYDMEAYVSVLENQVATLRQENEELAVHATLAYNYVQALKHRLNTKKPGLK